MLSPNLKITEDVIPYASYSTHVLLYMSCLQRDTPVVDIVYLAQGAIDVQSVQSPNIDCRYKHYLHRLDLTACLEGSRLELTLREVYVDVRHQA